MLMKNRKKSHVLCTCIHKFILQPCQGVMEKLLTRGRERVGGTRKVAGGLGGGQRFGQEVDGGNPFAFFHKF